MPIVKYMTSAYSYDRLKKKKENFKYNLLKFSTKCNYKTLKIQSIMIYHM